MQKKKKYSQITGCIDLTQGRNTESLLYFYFYFVVGV